MNAFRKLLVAAVLTTIGGAGAIAQSFEYSRLLVLDIPLGSTNDAWSHTSAIQVRLDRLYRKPTDDPGASNEFSPFEGQVRWLGPPRIIQLPAGETIIEAQLQCQPHSRLWNNLGASRIHIVGSEVLPSSTYTISVLAQDTHPSPTPVQLKTRSLCDLVEPFASVTSGHQPDVADITALTAKYLDPTSAHVDVYSALQTSSPEGSRKIDSGIGFGDLAVCVEAYKGKNPLLPIVCQCPPPTCVPCTAANAEEVCGNVDDCGDDGYCRNEKDSCGRCSVSSAN